MVQRAREGSGDAVWVANGSGWEPILGEQLLVLVERRRRHVIQELRLRVLLEQVGVEAASDHLHPRGGRRDGALGDLHRLGVLFTMRAPGVLRGCHWPWWCGEARLDARGGVCPELRAELVAEAWEHGLQRMLVVGVVEAA